jgi:isovaleryl-CoA dehydrogenase
MNAIVPNRLEKLRARLEEISEEEIAPYAEQVDAQARWPEEGMRALQEKGLMALHVPRRFGGMEEGMLALVVACESIGQHCSSTALCFGMHCVGTAVIAAKATRHQEEHYLRAIAEKRHITTLSLSEKGIGSHFYLPQTSLRREGDTFVVNGEKAFVTSGGHADSYVVNTLASDGGHDEGEFSCLIVDAETPGLTWGQPWTGFGMRGNSSRTLSLQDARIPARNLLGEAGDQVWYMFEVVVPFFLTAMSATYLGIAQAALDLTIQHMKTRRYEHSGERLESFEPLQKRIAHLWTEIEKSRLLLYAAAELGDRGDQNAIAPTLAAKADIARTVALVTDEAVAIGGGTAYGANSQISRLLRDARAAHVMAPTTEMLTTWLGRTLLNQPLF